MDKDGKNPLDDYQNQLYKLKVKINGIYSQFCTIEQSASLKLLLKHELNRIYSKDKNTRQNQVIQEFKKIENRYISYCQYQKCIGKLFNALKDAFCLLTSSNQRFQDITVQNRQKGLKYLQKYRQIAEKQQREFMKISNKKKLTQSYPTGRIQKNILQLQQNVCEIMGVEQLRDY